MKRTIPKDLVIDFVAALQREYTAQESLIENPQTDAVTLFTAAAAAEALEPFLLQGYELTSYQNVKREIG